jgi:hypothetical protein
MSRKAKTIATLVLIATTSAAAGFAVAAAAKEEREALEFKLPTAKQVRHWEALRAMRAKFVLGVPRKHLDKIAECESHGNPKSVGGGGLYRGKYQFDRQTWHAIGGKGDPVKAAEGEQDRRAALLIKERGSNPWPNCG